MYNDADNTDSKLYINNKTDSDSKATPEKIANIELIRWAFAKGYALGSQDFREGVHINFSETQSFFMGELEKICIK